MNYNDMAHMADEERKRRREEGTIPIVGMPRTTWDATQKELEIAKKDRFEQGQVIDTQRKLLERCEKDIREWNFSFPETSGSSRSLHFDLRAHLDGADKADSAAPSTNFVQVVGEPKPQGESITASGDAAPLPLTQADIDKVTANAPQRELHLPWRARKIKSSQGLSVIIDKDDAVLFEAMDNHLAIGIAEAVNAYWKSECVIDRQKFSQREQYCHIKIDEQAGRIKELEKGCADLQREVDMNDEQNLITRLDEAHTEVDRLREALEAKSADYTAAHSEAQALRNKLKTVAMKGAESEAEHTTDASDDPIRDTPDRANSPTPLKPLKLACADDIKSLRELVDWNTNRLLDRDAGVVAAIAEMQAQIDSLTEAVLMSLGQHKAVQQGMAMWGTGDFERMAKELREMKGGEWEIRSERPKRQ